MNKYTFSLVLLTLCFCKAAFPRGICGTSDVDDKTLIKVLNEQFSNLVTGQSKSSIGNFASLDLKDAEVSFSGNSILKQGHVVGVKASGAVSDGFLSIFNGNSPLNTNFSLEFQLSLLNLKHRSIEVNCDSVQRYGQKKDAIREKYRIQEIGSKNRLGIINLKYRKKKIENTCRALNQALSDETAKDVSKIDSLKIDSLRYALALNKSDSNEIDKEIADYPTEISETEDLEHARVRELNTIDPEFDVVAFNFGWFSFFYKISNARFKLFDPTRSYDKQIADSSNMSHEFKVQYNRYNWTHDAFQTYFYCIGIDASLGDNLSTLAKKEITEVKNYGPNPNDRITTKKYNVFAGSYEKGLSQINVYFDYYRFIFNDNIAALHFYPEFQFSEKSIGRPMYNQGFGFLFSFKSSKKDDKSIVNTETFVTFQDVGNNAIAEQKPASRYVVGMRFSLPIAFKGN